MNELYFLPGEGNANYEFGCWKKYRRYGSSE